MQEPQESAASSKDKSSEKKRVSIGAEDLKSVFGDRFKVAYVKSSIIPGASSSIMIPSNEPCPVEPHNHDKLALDRRLDKYIIIEL